MHGTGIARDARRTDRAEQAATAVEQARDPDRDRRLRDGRDEAHPRTAARTAVAASDHGDFGVDAQRPRRRVGN